MSGGEGTRVMQLLEERAASTACVASLGIASNVSACEWTNDSFSSQNPAIINEKEHTIINKERSRSASFLCIILTLLTVISIRNHQK